MNNDQYKILYVDDESANLNAFRLLFDDKYKVFIASSAEEGFELDAHHLNPQSFWTNSKPNGDPSDPSIYHADNRPAHTRCVIYTIIINFKY